MQRIVSTAFATLLLGLPLTGQDLEFHTSTVTVDGGMASIQLLDDGMLLIKAGLFKLLVTAGQGSNDGQLGRPMQP